VNPMNKESEQSIELSQAQSLIREACCVLSSEKVPLAESLGRFSAERLTALEPLPGFDQSLRDGYALGEYQPVKNGKQAHSFRVVGEVAAGDTRELQLHCGEAIRIMTGGLLPAQCVAVVPQETCMVAGDMLEVPVSFAAHKQTFIHAKGSEIAKGHEIVSKGSRVSPEKLIALAGVGYQVVPVVRKPGLCFFCSGSELVASSAEKVAGKKYSANSPLLQGLIESSGAKLLQQQTVGDDPEAVAKTMADMAQTGCDIMISTGGMGPGKFDLIEETFCRLGGKVIYQSLQLRPGKATLFGILDKTLFFGMPGPPPAVRLLFNELIRPAILAIQGAKHCEPQKIQATLTENIMLYKRGLPRLKSGIMSLQNTACLVRQAGRTEAANCYIYCPETRTEIEAGENVMLHLLPGTELST